ncbi:MAG: DNA polymerase III subunit beta [Gammaproteobacteria bacterium]|nr:DNA polymerase III subunit beta [Gammaproteobacteria bacterium]MCY4219051.1 DNA polymerase III subunit beta [Gammaproteobacteria bacterium]MCY4275661.1 DNA polymerase III subunit beta [Gammaproteobacteria bacterium]
MKFKLNRDVLVSPLTLLNSVIEKTQTLPILANIYFSIEGGVLTMVGSDLEVEITQTIDNLLSEDGSFTVSGKKITDIVRTLPDNAQITFEHDSNNHDLIILSGKSRFKLKTLPAENYPKLKTEDWEERFKIDWRILKETMDKVSFSMAVHDARFSLNGVSIIIENKQLIATATDGHRLARTKFDLEVDIQNERQVIIPRKAVNEIGRMLEIGQSHVDQPKEDKLKFADTSMVTFEYSRNHIRVTAPGTVLIAKQIDGKYPKFDDVLEVGEDMIKLSLDRRKLTDILSRVSVISDDKFKGVGVRLSLTNGKLKINTNTTENQHAYDEMPIEYEGDEILFGYNATYLLDICKVIQTSKINVTLDNESSICYFHQPKDDQSLWLVMPMRL